MNRATLIGFFKKRWWLILSLLILFVLLLIIKWKAQKIIEHYGKQWITDFLQDNYKLQVLWQGWEWDFLSSSVTIGQVKVKGGEQEVIQFWSSADQITISYNPFLLISGNILAIRSINVRGAQLMIHSPRMPDSETFKALMTPKTVKKSQGKWSVRVDQVVVEGKELSMDISEPHSSFTLSDFIGIVKQIDKKGPFPIQFGFKGGEFHWKTLHRFLGSGKIKGNFTPQQLHIDSSSLIIPDEGNVAWTGEIKKGDGPVVINGHYSGELFSDTLASFTVVFKEMQGKIASRGHITGQLKKIKVDAEVEAQDFIWKRYNFTRVKGYFTYYSGLLDFKKFSAIWRTVPINLESQVDCKKRKAAIALHFSQLPTLLFFKNWEGIFSVPPPDWSGDVNWVIEWTGKKMTIEGKGEMSAPFSSADESPVNTIRISTGFGLQDGMIAFHHPGITLGENSLEGEGTYTIHSNKLSMTYTCLIKGKEGISILLKSPVKGRGTIQGRIEGEISNLQYRGAVDAENIQYKGHSLDHLTADFTYQQKALNLLNVRGEKRGAMLSGEGTITWLIPHEDPAIKSTWSVRRLPITEIFSFIPYKPGFPCEGEVSGQGDFRTKHKLIESTGKFSCTQLSLLGQSPIALDGKFNLTHGKYIFKDIILKRGGEKIQGDISFEKEKGWLVNANTSSWNIEPIQLSGGNTLPVKGNLAFDFSGVPQEIKGNIEIKKLSYSGYGAWWFSSRVTLKDKHLRASFDYPQGDGDAQMDICKEFPFKVTARLKDFLALDPNMGLIDPNIAHSLLLTGAIECKGLLTRSESIEGKFKGEQIKIAGPIGRFENLLPCEIALKDNELSLPYLIMKGEKGNLELQGIWNFKKGFDVNALGTISLETFKDKIPGVKGLSGDTQASINLKGTQENPQFQGELKITEGSFFIPHYNIRVDNVQGIIGFTRDTATIEKLTGDTSGGGSIDIRGTAGYGGKELKSLDIVALFDNIYIYQRNLYRAYLEGELKCAGTKDSGVITGDVVIREARYTGYENILQLLLAKKRAVEKTKEIITPEKGKGLIKWLDKIELGIQLDIGDDFWIKSPFYSIALKGNLLIKGSLAAPWLYGDIEALEGDVFIGSQAFTLASGYVKLNNPEISEPIINAVALKDVNNFRLRLTVLGPLRDPGLQFSSTPYMSQPEILNMVFFGLSTERGETSQQESDLLSLMLSATSRVVDNMFGEKVAYYTGLEMLTPSFLPKDLFKVDILDVKLAEEGGGLQRLTLGKTLSRRLKIKYSRFTGTEEKELAEAEYTLTDYITLIGAQDNQGFYSFDLNFGLDF